MTRKLKMIIISVVILAVLFVSAIFFSIIKFDVANPFAVLNGLYQITFADKPYAEIRAYPKVIIAKPPASLNSYMEAKGFTENEEKQLGALRVFENDDECQSIMCSVNAYFARWHWQ